MRKQLERKLASLNRVYRLLIVDELLFFVGLALFIAGYASQSLAWFLVGMFVLLAEIKLTHSVLRRIEV